MTPNIHVSVLKRAGFAHKLGTAKTCQWLNGASIVGLSGVLVHVDGNANPVDIHCASLQGPPLEILWWFIPDTPSVVRVRRILPPCPFYS
jgi:hypothetical protein